MPVLMPAESPVSSSSLIQTRPDKKHFNREAGVKTRASKLALMARLQKTMLDDVQAEQQSREVLRSKYGDDPQILGPSRFLDASEDRNYASMLEQGYNHQELRQRPSLFMNKKAPYGGARTLLK